MSDARRLVGEWLNATEAEEYEARGRLLDAIDALAAERDRLARELALLEGNRHPGYIIGSHWMATAYSRICAGEDEAEVMLDYGYARVAANESVGRCAWCGTAITRGSRDEGFKICSPCWKAAGAPSSESARPCTCHPDDNPPRPCPQQYALSECRKAAAESETQSLCSCYGPDDLRRVHYPTMTCLICGKPLPAESELGGQP